MEMVATARWSVPAIGSDERQRIRVTGGCWGRGAHGRVAACQLRVSEKGDYNVAEVLGECIIMALLGKGDAHYNMCSSFTALEVP